MSVVTAAGVTVISLPGCATALNKFGKSNSQEGVRPLDTPYLGKGLIIASLGQLASQGIIREGESLIPGGDALKSKDIIIANDKIAITVGVLSPDPWGYPVGSVLDMAQVSGTIQNNVADSFKSGHLVASDDRLWDMRLLMNSWDSWGPSNCGTPTFEIVENYTFDNTSAANPALKVSLEYKENSAADPQTFTDPLIIETYYSLAPGDDYVKVKSLIINNTAKTFKSRATGYNFSSKSTSLTSPGRTVYNENNQKAQNDFIAIYNPEYTNGLIVPGVEDVYVGTGYADSYSTYDYLPLTQTEIVAFMRTDAVRDIANTTEQMLDIKGVPASERVVISGILLDDAQNPIPNGVVGVERTDGKAWTFVTWVAANQNGEYEVQLNRPGKIDEYRLYGMEENYAITPDSEKLVLSGAMPAGDNVAIKAAPLKLKKTVPVTVNVTDQNGNPLYSKIQVLGIKRNVVDYLANNLFFTDFDGKGKNVVLVAPGEFEIEVSNGIDFFAKGVRFKGHTDKDTQINITLDSIGDLRKEGWYNADLHHHVNKSDACTSPENFIRSNLAAGTSIAFTSDHDDSSANIDVTTLIGKHKLDIEHIPAVEISASWSHFNVVPKSKKARDFMLDLSEKTGGKYKFDQYDLFKNIVDSVHSKDMYFIANHPWISYGLFYAEELNKVPGGYYGQYDLIELNAGVSEASNIKTMESARQRWTKALSGGKKYFLTGSSDTHDVLDSTGTYTGLARTFVKVNDKANVLDAYAEGLALGHGYASYGPLMFPSDSQMFGETFKVQKGDHFEISLPVKSVNGIAKIEIFGKEGVVSTQKVNNAAEMIFTQNVKTDVDNWYQVVVTDSKGKSAFANPYFVTVS
ncbi:CehA/McbA family metallohydrolase [Parendozoicomonas haliclonae]|uniref:Uncharacterized protein n=1 Tax=Parendozoicomonas haliclonae TaxID=1960125 RepID=A0A1X7AR32_9GAMM|nr:CehA/McbA family metallohydrolase [Parendozoicomonas haliclonae]SMA50774.1 hypothetical protein EHSB41UT_04591 [Parendozoicomonas haliclonae]